MKRKGPMSIEQHRDWVAMHGDWELAEPRPGKEIVDQTMQRLADALGETEAKLVNAAIARADYTLPEITRVEEWARQALTIVTRAAERAAWNGTPLSDNVLFHELATRFSPAYGKALGTTPARIPSEMKVSTLEAARDDIKAAGLRLQQLYEFARREVKGWYKPVLTADGWRVRPLKGPALDKKRAERGMAPFERVQGRLLRADDPPRQIFRRVDTFDPFVAVTDAHVTAEVEYEPVRAGLRSLGVSCILDSTRLILNIPAARAEFERLEAKLEKAKAVVAAVVRPHRKAEQVTTTMTRQTAGAASKLVITTVTVDGEVVSHKQEYRETKRRVTKDTEHLLKPKKKMVSVPPWTSAEIAALAHKASAEQQYYALRPVVESLEDELGHEVLIRTQMRQAINRRWNATSFWPENVAGDSSKELEPEVPATYDAETGEEEEGPTQRVTTTRGRLFSVYRRGRATIYPREPLAGVDVSSSQWQILAVLLNDTILEAKLADKSAHEIAGPQVWPDDPGAPARAKQVLVAGGYGSSPDRINWKTGIPLEEVQLVLNALGEPVQKFIEYAREVAHAVDPMKGFTFTDPFDGVEVVWRPISATQVYVASDKVQISTYVPGNNGAVDRPRLARQIPPMLIHTLDSAFSGLVIEGLHAREVKNIVALFDCWLVPESQVHLINEVVLKAGEPWLKMLGAVYDALLNYKDSVSEPEWMVGLKERWKARLEAKQWPRFRTKPVTPVSWVGGDQL